MTKLKLNEKMGAEPNQLHEQYTSKNTCCSFFD